MSAPAPCGYCRRCAIHDDPGGCLEVARWERENPDEAIASAAQTEWAQTHPLAFLGWAERLREEAAQ